MKIIKTLVRKMFPYTLNCLFVFLVERRFKKTRNIEDKVKNLYKQKFNHPLDLEDPKSFYDKVNFLKVHQCYPDFQKYVDKTTAKNIAKECDDRIIVSKTYHIFDSFSDFKKAYKSKKIPDPSVIKLNNGSGDVYFYKNNEWENKYGNKVSRRTVFAALKCKIKINYYHFNYEKCYDGIVGRIIVEEYLPSVGGLAEYKIFCNYGTPKMVNVVYGRQTGNSAKEAFTDIDLKIFPVRQDQDIIEQKDIFIPSCWKDMISFATRVSKKFPMFRVDMLTDGLNYYFCEFTFYDFGGNAIFYPIDWNYKIGSLFDISDFVRTINSQKEKE